VETELGHTKPKDGFDLFGIFPALRRTHNGHWSLL
jgi:hypothetical protein